jgi:hypothetical protein
MLDESGAERRRWLLRGARISNCDGPGFNANGSDVAIETLEVACERIDPEA